MKRLPLDGIRIADLTMMWAGPYATRHLADMGAEIIKIESPRAWDNIRTLTPQPGVADPWNSSAYFNYYNRDKKSLTLDLSIREGRDAFLELVAKCDIVLENYRADVMDNLNLGYEVLRAENPSIIMISMAGFGKTGPERDSVGFGPIIEQMSGLVSLSGYGDGEPIKTGISYGDPIGGLYAVGAVALGLIQRKRTGKGTFVDLAQRESAALFIGEHFVAASLRGETPVHHGNRDVRYAPQGVYPCRGVEQWLAISVTNDDEWRALCGVIRTPELAGLAVEARRARHDELDARISEWTSLQDPQVAMERLQQRGVPAGRVLNSFDILEDPNLNARDYWHELPHPRMAPWRQPRTPWRAVPEPRLPGVHAPLFGQHNREILGGLLGKSEDEIAALYALGVCADAPVNPGVG